MDILRENFSAGVCEEGMNYAAKTHVVIIRDNVREKSLTNETSSKYADIGSSGEGLQCRFPFPGNF